jgi:hypothetical protein
MLAGLKNLFVRILIKLMLRMGLVPKRLRAAHLIRQWTEGTVIAGPFTGMRYVEQSVGSALYPKLLGTYEKELQPVIERLCAKEYRWIIDVGAAEGYYAIGMALRCQGAHIVAFESVEAGRQLIHQLAERNQIETKVDIHGYCDSDTLRKQLKEIQKEKCLIIMDVEGFEIELLEPRHTPELIECDILVELHDGKATGPIGDEIQSRFESTHRIERFWSRQRCLEDLPSRESFWVNWRMIQMLSEGRKRGLSWLYMESLVAACSRPGVVPSA